MGIRRMGIRRILHVVHGYPPESGGGTESYVSSLLAAQKEVGAEPLLLHGSFEPRPEVHLEERTDLPHEAWRLHRADTYSDYWDRAHDPKVSALFEDFLGRTRPDLVHVHQWIRLSDDLVQRAERLGIPCVLSLHDLSISCPACFRQRPGGEHCERAPGFDSCADCVPLRGHESEAELRLGLRVFRENARAALENARIVLAATRSTASLVCRSLDLPEDLVRIEPFGLPRRFRDPPPFAPPADGEPLRLAFWGLVTKRKGVEELCRALSLLRAEGPLDGRIEVHVFGRIDTEELERGLKDEARGLPVRFHGRYEYAEIEALRPHLACFPSSCFETYGLVLDEAFELGIPALVTEVGAFAERLRGGGFLVPPNDPEALAAGLARILEQPRLLAEAASRIPPPPPLLEEHARRLLALYEEAAALPGRGGGGPSPSLRLELEWLRRCSATKGPPLRRGLDSTQPGL